MALPSSGLFFGAFLIAFYLGYRWILPRPIPGIPHNREAIENIFGDLPALKEHARKTGEKMSWLPLQAKKLNSPIIQIFANPLTKPWVILTEFRESQDILLRRTKEFDRSDHFGNIFKGLTPDHHISMKTANPQFKAHRRLIQDLMTPAFLNEVCFYRCSFKWESSTDFSRFRLPESMNRSRLLSISGPKNLVWQMVILSPLWTIFIKRP